MKEQSRSEKEIFHAALELTDAGQRRELLDAACHDAPTLRRQVEELLAAHEGDMLQVPAGAVAEPSDEANVSTGQMIGNYKLLEKIGEGGFGVVYMADQLQPIQRRVALKVIKAGMDTRQVIARFEAERQALALMDHPHIARVLDAGTTDAGRPFFVMELVRGVPVTEYCDERRLSTQDRLNIFTEICTAVQHAHQKGVIHRDIKPNNILVTTNGDRPVPKVIDFGIAKATQGRLTDKTLFTQFRQFMGTPAYMSPEQAQMSAVDVDTRSDIYSLGVLLYELLTGKTPLDSNELLKVGVEEVCRRIRQEEPPKPSTRLSSLTFEERTTIAKDRRTVPERLGHLIHGDLDWIVLKALEKDRSRRYETANSLKLDVQRFLTNEPVSAVAPTAAYKMSKFARRNKNVISIAATVFALLFTGSVVSTWQAVRATQQFKRATTAEKDARKEEQRANQLRSRAEASERRARRSQYVAEMMNAQRELSGLNSRNTWELLARQIPGPNEPDFRGFEWRSLWNKYRRELFQLKGHADEIRSLAFSPDGNWLASGSTDGTARLWNIQTRQQVWQFKGGTHCNEVVFSPDGQRLVTVFWQGDNVLWDVSDHGNPQRIREFDAKGVFSPDGKTLTGGFGSLTQWSLSGEVLRQYADPELNKTESGSQVHTGRIWDREISPDGRLLVSAGEDSTAKIWNTATGQLVESLRGHTADVLAVAIASNDGGVIVTTSVDGTARVWDREGKELHQLRLGNAPLVDLGFSADGTSLVIADHYGGLRVLETETWTEIAAFQSPGGRGLVECSPSNPSLVMTAASDGVIRAWDPAPSDSALDHAHPVRSLEFSPDGRLLAVGMENGIVQFWDVLTRSRVFATNLTNLHGVEHIGLTPFTRDFVKFSPDSKRVAIIGPDKVVTVWDIEKRRPQAVINSPVKNAPFWSVAFSPASPHLYTGTAWSNGEQGVLVWDLQNPKAPVAKLDHPGHYGIGCIAISFDGTTLASGHEDVRLWNLPQRQLLRSLDFPGRNNMERGAFSLCFSPDGTWLAAGDVSDSVWIWDTQSWQQEVLSLRDIVSCVDFSAEGDRLAASDISGMTKLWDLETRQTVATYSGSVADFSPDGKILAIGCEGRLSSDSMPAAGRVRLHYAPPLAEIDRDPEESRQ